MQLRFEQTCAPSKGGNNIVTKASFLMRRKHGGDISLLGKLFVQEYISTIRFVYVLCVYNATNHILPVVCFYDFFVFNSSLHTVQ